MKTIKLPANVTRAFYKVGFQLKKHSPEILVVAGVAGTVTSAVMACKATTKLSGILEESKEKIDQIHGYVEDHGYSEVYTEQDSKKDLTIVYAQTGVELVKLYGPAVALGTASIACIFAGNNILRKRAAALAAAYTAVDTGFKDYRKRVVERFGEDLDRELKYNIKAKEIEETVVNEDGTESTVTRTVETVDPAHRNPYTRVFDETCPDWTKNADDNKMFLILQQNYANEKLRTKGMLTLNQVYEMLGMDPTREGSAVGWVYDKNNPDLHNEVDFGMFDIHDESKRLFMNGHERSIWLEFNVDGNVWDLMK